jgi:hypothetical protein
MSKWVTYLILAALAVLVITHPAGTAAAGAVGDQFVQGETKLLTGAGASTAGARVSAPGFSVSG